jgi:hypothetical protein
MSPELHEPRDTGIHTTGTNVWPVVRGAALVAQRLQPSQAGEKSSCLT